jgi:hypothetical protein
MRSLQHIRPANCTLVIGLPTTEDKFTADLSRTDKDYVRGKSISDFRLGLLRTWTLVKPEFCTLGMMIREHADRGAFATAFGPSTIAVVLFAHWCDDLIEFSDGMVPVAEVVGLVPESFDGILDLTVCTSEPLAAALDIRRPACRVKIHRNRAHLSFWMWFYIVLAKRLSEQPLTYYDAFDWTMEHFREAR